MRKKIALVGILSISLIVVGLFQIKYKVSSLKRDLSEINSQLAADKDSIRVLKAEWAYLNEPERIGKLASKYLSLNNIVIAQVYDSKQVNNLYVASVGGKGTSSGLNTAKPVLKPILSSARGYR